MWIPWAAIVLDVAILVPFTVLKAQADPLTVVVTVVVVSMIVMTQWLVVHRRNCDGEPSQETSAQRDSE